MPPAKRRPIVLAISLVLLAPLVGEWLLGNQPITSLGSIVLLAPLYGCGALLVRETSRHLGRGWLTILLLAAAYALLEEGPIDQMLWNPHYGGIDMAVAYADTRIDALGTSIGLIQDVLTLHTIWSIAVPIALIEAFDPAPKRPWLGAFGVAIATAVFFAGSAFLTYSQIESEKFIATPSQFAAASLAIVALVIAAFAIPAPSRQTAMLPPSPRMIGLASFFLTSLLMARDFIAELTSGWSVVGLWCVLIAAGIALVLRWSSSPQWGMVHKTALAGGALMTYVWVGCVQAQSLGIPVVVAVTGNVVFGLGAIVLFFLAMRAIRRTGLGRAAALP
ncbi:hypothetical protein [Mesorhizobium sp. 1M-11]|uniref:hypothetical protein n=1 Tax=Mesorhizobium sp. 1M-11 TaxID=1529006 RepID=UPI000AFDB99B|nr:hypothetical protein [Mesorhizobium sp. 1M-11]